MSAAIFKSILSASLLCAIMAPFAAADPGLIGRSVTFQGLTYDDPAQPLFVGAMHKARVGKGVEFELGREGAQNEFDVVPVLVDIGEARVELRYSGAEPGDLWASRFNGYVLTFQPDCLRFGSAQVDQEFTNLPFDNKRVFAEGNVLRLNVSAQSHDRDSRIAVDLEFADCPGS